MNIPLPLWEEIANCFKLNGYTVAFNLARNTNDFNNYNFSGNFLNFNIPAHLIPLISEKIAYTCARWGGGFDLAHIFSKTSKCILFHLSENIKCENNRQKDHPINFSEGHYLKLCNKKVYKTVLLTEMKFNQYLKNQINSI